MASGMHQTRAAHDAGSPTPALAVCQLTRVFGAAGNRFVLCAEEPLPFRICVPTAAMMPPDVYASVNLGDLGRLKAKGLMQTYAVYMRNEMQIMVAKGKPKGIRSISDLARQNVRTSMPNPINECIMQFYARKVLERFNVWQTISGGSECVSCATGRTHLVYVGASQRDARAHCCWSLRHRYRLEDGSARSGAQRRIH